MLCITILFFLSCENEPPFIRNPIFNIVTYQAGSSAGGVNSIYLSLHFVLYDENGLEDVDYIDLINTDTDILWRINRTELEQTQYGDSTYYGYSFYEYANAQAVLTGNYLIKVRDKAGNETDLPIAIELQGFEDTLIKPQIPDYTIETKDNKREIVLSGMKYHSVEAKVLNKPDLFNNTRKKFITGEKIILSDTELPPGSIISLRVNSDIDDRLIFFLKNYTIR